MLRVRETIHSPPRRACRVQAAAVSAPKTVPSVANVPKTVARTTVHLVRQQLAQAHRVRATTPSPHRRECPVLVLHATLKLAPVDPVRALRVRLVPPVLVALALVLRVRLVPPVLVALAPALRVPVELHAPLRA